MARITLRTEKSGLLLVSIALLMITVLASWCVSLIKANSNSLYLNTVLTSQELDTKLKPLYISNRFSPDSRQICLWFRYSAARDGDHVLISWYYAGKLIQKESLRLTEAGGIRVFYLVTEDGASLPVGEYAVSINSDKREITKLQFHVLPKKEPGQGRLKNNS